MNKDHFKFCISGHGNNLIDVRRALSEIMLSLCGPDDEAMKAMAKDDAKFTYFDHDYHVVLEIGHNAFVDEGQADELRYTREPFRGGQLGDTP